MAKKIRYGKVEVPTEDFLDDNITAHISIRLPLVLVKDLKKLSLTEEYGGKYQVLVRDVLTEYVQKQKGRKRASA